jgi:hypothetical protein
MKLLPSTNSGQAHAAGKTEMGMPGIRMLGIRMLGIRMLGIRMP